MFLGGAGASPANALGKRWGHRSPGQVAGQHRQTTMNTRRPRESLERPDIGPIGPDRNWKGIGISLLVIMAVLSCIGLSIVLLSQALISPSCSQMGRVRRWASFEIHDPEAKWISAQEVIYRSWNGDIFKLNVYSNETELLLKNSTFATKFAVSPDKKFVLLGYNVQPVSLSYSQKQTLWRI
uniref:Dipeptidylpeptidase IV N-terminal domain-containing protein n=1 Tax=Poecilia latipinna TaxID=48699 RepID=A0A3B3U5M6_9TELE